MYKKFIIIIKLKSLMSDPMDQIKNTSPEKEKKFYSENVTSTAQCLPTECTADTNLPDKLGAERHERPNSAKPADEVGERK
jgi:hypothetical protein